MRSRLSLTRLSVLCLTTAGAVLSTGLVAGAQSPAQVSAQVSAPLDALRPVLETHANFDDEAGGDADADDPAIWVRQGRVADSVVLGALKNGGLDAYDLDGQLLQHVDTPPAPADGLEAGRFNNVDVLRGTRWGSIAVVSDRGRDRLRAYRIDPRGAAAGGDVLTDITVAAAPLLFSPGKKAVEEQRTGYGLALRQDGTASYAVVSRRSTSQLGLFRLTASKGKLSYDRTARLRLPDTFELSDGTSWSPCGEPGEGPQVEGMVVDQARDVLYAAQEDVGVWRIPLDGAGFGEPELVQKVKEFGREATYDTKTEECEISETAHPDSGTHITADAEGLTLVERAGRPVRVLVSSQGDDTFGELTLGGAWVRGFRIRASAGVDSVQASDGSALTTTPLGPRFPQGLLVVHDGENTPTVTADGEDRPNTNFKFVPWTTG